MPFYAVAYGNTIRLAKAKDKMEACKDCYGLADAQRMTIATLPKNPKYMSQKAKAEIYKSLAADHKQKTGNEVPVTYNH